MWSNFIVQYGALSKRLSRFCHPVSLESGAGMVKSVSGNSKNALSDKSTSSYLDALGRKHIQE
jgi:hypothetical protein